MHTFSPRCRTTKKLLKKTNICFLSITLTTEIFGYYYIHIYMYRERERGRERDSTIKASSGGIQTINT